jgi:hypothetical protein
MMVKPGCRFFYVNYDYHAPLAEMAHTSPRRFGSTEA